MAIDLSVLPISFPVRSSAMATYASTLLPTDNVRFHPNAQQYISQVNGVLKFGLWYDSIGMAAGLPSLASQLNGSVCDLEHWANSAPADQADPIGCATRCEALADTYGLTAVMVPDRRFLDAPGNAAAFALQSDQIIIQAQQLIATPTAFAAECTTQTNTIKAANPACQVWVQVSFLQGSPYAVYAALQLLTVPFDGISVTVGANQLNSLQTLVNLLRPGGLFTGPTMFPTLAQYRQATALELGPYEDGVATTGSTTGLLECASPLFQSTIDQSQKYKDWYIFRPNAALQSDMVRQVDTYTPSTGMFTPDLAWTNSPSGEPFELHGIVEPSEDLPSIINDALNRCTVMSEVTLPAATLTMRQSLASITWLTDEKWVRKAGVLAPNESREQVDPYILRPLKGEVVNDGGTLYLNYAPRSFNGTETIYLRVEKPAYQHCAGQGGILGTQAGLYLDTDFCIADPLWVASAALVEAWRRLSHLLEPLANQKLVRDRAEASSWFSYLTSQNFQPEPMSIQRVRTFGPPRW